MSIIFKHYILRLDMIKKYDHKIMVFCYALIFATDNEQLRCLLIEVYFIPHLNI